MVFIGLIIGGIVVLMYFPIFELAGDNSVNMAEPIEAGTRPGFRRRRCTRRAAPAQQARRATVDVLEEQSGLDPQRFVQTLATTLHYPAAAMEELHRMAPVRRAAVRRGAGARVSGPARRERCAGAGHGDPFDSDLQAWAEQRVAARFSWRLAHRADVAAYLAPPRGNAACHGRPVASGDRDASVESGAADLSFKTISEDTSPVVKLVHSTVYDALKASVSDIHLETTPGGPEHPLPHRRRADHGRIAGGLELAEQVISPHQDHVGTRHRRTPGAAGRTLQGVGAWA